MTVRVVHDWPALAAHTDAWWALLGRSGTDEPTLSPLWLEAWWQVFGAEEGRALCAVLVHDGDRLIGLAPLLRRRVWYRHVIPLRRLELLASGERQQDEICSDYLNVIAERGREDEVASQLVGALLGGSAGSWDELVLDVMHGHATMTMALIRQLGRVAPVDIRARRPCPHTALPDTWDGYLARLPSRHRYVVKRSVRDLEEWAGGDLELAQASTPAELAEGQRILVSLHGQRWSEDGRDGVFASERFLAFHRQVMPALLARGQLDLLWLCARGEPIAAIYNILWNRKVYFYQCGRRTDLPRKLRPGIAMHAYAMQRAIERGMTAYDFLSGASQYKKQLATAEAPLVRLRATRPRSLPALATHWAMRGEALARELRARARALRSRSRPAHG